MNSISKTLSSRQRNRINKQLYEQLLDNDYNDSNLSSQSENDRNIDSNEHNVICPNPEILSSDTEISEQFELHNHEIESELDYDNLESELDNDNFEFNYENLGKTKIDECKTKSLDFQSELALWALKNRITHVALNDLLSLLRKNGFEVAKDSRTVLKTKSSVSQVKTFGSGEYVYFGIKNGLSKFLICNYPYEPEISLAVNIDGVPISKSANRDFWPILVSVFNFEQGLVGKPFMVALFCGETKPHPLKDYLGDFINELQDLERNGFSLGGKIYTVNLKGPFILDTPAKAFIKCTKGHTGYSSCDKCVIEGEYRENRMVFIGLDSERRTDKSFVDKLDDDHHSVGEHSPLVELNIGMVSQFPYDYLHLVCLGVMRRLAYFWMRQGPFSVRLGQKNISTISEKLKNSRFYIPSDFARKPRALKHIDKWKGTELRQFLLYTSPIVLIGVLGVNVLKHFRLFHCAIYIFSSRELCKTLCGYASQLIKIFVDEIPKLYGEKFVVMNVHSLLHLYLDVLKYGALDGFSAFSFENELHFIKRELRTPNKPLQQICKRLSEKENFDLSLIITKNEVQFISPYDFDYNSNHRRNLPKNGKSFRKIKCERFIVSSCPSDSCFLLENGDYVRVINIFNHEDKRILVFGQVYTKIKDLFDYPMKSSRLGIVRASDLASVISVFELSFISQKCVALPHKGGMAVIPMLH